MKTQKIINTLKKWSPRGLCAGTLVKKDGDPKKSLGCAMGCLALETLHTNKILNTKENLQWIKDEKAFEDLFATKLYVLTLNKFGLSRADVLDIETYNDACLQGATEDVLPESLTRVIKQLRSKNRNYNSRQRNKSK